MNTPPEPAPETTPRFILWRHLLDEHKLTLLESELDEIINKAVVCAHPSPACAEAAARGDNLGSVLLPLTSTEDASAKGNPAGRSLFSNLAKKLAHEINKIHAQGPWSETQNPDDYIASIILRHCSAHLAPAKQGGEANPQAVRFAWEAGFKLCRSYGDNWIHCDGEQRERHWKLFLESKGYQHFFSASPIPPQPLREVIERAMKEHCLSQTGFSPSALPAAEDGFAKLTDRLITALTPLLAHDKRSDGERSDKGSRTPTT